MTEKRLGRITSARFGHGGYQDACIGLSVSLGGERSKWTEHDRDAEIAKSVRFLSTILKQAKVHDVAKLKDIPVEVEFDGMALKSWRILTEVL